MDSSVYRSAGHSAVVRAPSRVEAEPGRSGSRTTPDRTTTRTGQQACVIRLWPVEPSRNPASAPRPRPPVTTMQGPSPGRAARSAGCALRGISAPIAPAEMSAHSSRPDLRCCRVGRVLRRTKVLRGRRRDFLVIDRGPEVGGTWRDNTYPGAACDVPSQLYSFSFALNPDWTRTFSSQSNPRRTNAALH